MVGGQARQPICWPHQSLARGRLRDSLRGLHHRRAQRGRRGCRLTPSSNFRSARRLANGGKAATMLLATVPAAFQYGLWDSNPQDRCRRLELLLLTELDSTSYWQAATAAAWRRSRGYFVLASLLWLAATFSSAERITWMQALAGMAAGVILWGFYFALGFRAFARGRQANQLGVVLTLLLPLATALLAHSDWRMLAILLPPGSVYFGSTESPNLWWLIGPASAAAFRSIPLRTLVAAARRIGIAVRWYDAIRTTTPNAQA